jgi:uncharacterized protein
MPPPVIALMLKAPRIGAVKTRLAASLGAPRATAIYRQLVERQIRALPSGWPVTVHHAPPGAAAAMRLWLGALRPEMDYRAQSAGGLGARLSAVFAREFAHGAPAVLVIGGDCPGLDATILRRAARALSRAEVVLGPTRDGGYYLIGLKKPCARLFAGIRWSTPVVLAQTRDRIRAAGLSVTLLPMLEDVDDLPSWHRARGQGLLKPP